MEVTSPLTGISMAMYTTQVSLQFYSGNFLNGTIPRKLDQTFGSTPQCPYLPLFCFFFPFIFIWIMFLSNSFFFSLLYFILFYFDLYLVEIQPWVNALVLANPRTGRDHFIYFILFIPFFFFIHNFYFSFSEVTYQVKINHY
jgi:hypothetical protein